MVSFPPYFHTIPMSLGFFYGSARSDFDLFLWGEYLINEIGTPIAKSSPTRMPKLDLRWYFGCFQMSLTQFKFVLSCHTTKLSTETDAQQHLVVRDDFAHFKTIDWMMRSEWTLYFLTYLWFFMPMNVLCHRKMNTGQTIQAGPGCKLSNLGKSCVSHCMYQQVSLLFFLIYFLKKKACHKITTADRFWFLFCMCIY